MTPPGTVPGREPDSAAPAALAAQAAAREEVLSGLAASPKTLPCKLFYDEAGSRLFDRICELPEYYPTRTELAILRARLPEIALRLGPDCLVIEYGSGSGLKTDLLLRALERPAGYVPIEISESYLEASVARLRRRHPGLEILPLRADYTRPQRIPTPARRPRRRLVFFPGSTIGNFDPDEARAFLTRARRTAGRGGRLLIGVDLRKDPAVLERAYDDAEGVTARFNLNLLRRLNRELEGDLRLDRFRHRAVWNDGRGRIEMHLESLVDQVLRVAGRSFPMRAGETIHTENSYKYTEAGFADLAATGGWRVDRVWTDAGRLFSVQLLEADGC